METVGQNRRQSGQPDEQDSVGVRGNSAQTYHSYSSFSTHVTTVKRPCLGRKLRKLRARAVLLVRTRCRLCHVNRHIRIESQRASTTDDIRCTAHFGNTAFLSIDVASSAFFLRGLLWTLTSVGRDSPVQSARHASTDRARCHRSGSSTWKESPSFAKPAAFERDAWNEGARLRRVACRSLPLPISTSTPWDLDFPPNSRTIPRRHKLRASPPEERSAKRARTAKERGPCETSVDRLRRSMEKE